MKVNGLHSILIVKTAHSRYPLLMFEQLVIERGEWESMLGNVDAVDLMAVKFVDLQPKQFISTCSVATCGPPRITKHHGVIPRLQVAFEYLRFAAGIDLHNHLRTGSAGFEDVWLTKSPQHRQFARIIGFLFTIIKLQSILGINQYPTVRSKWISPIGWFASRTTIL